MQILKGFGLGILSFILFFSLVGFGICYTVNQVALNPHFVTNTLDAVDFSQIIEESLNEQDSNNNIPVDLQTAIIDTIRKTEPVIKEHLAVALEDTYAYLKGKASTPDLKSALSNSVMNSEFVAELMEDIDLSELFNEVLKEQGGTDDFSEIFTDTFSVTIDRLEPSLKQQIVNLSDPVFKYLLRETAGINLKAAVRQTLLSTDFITEVIKNLDLTSMVRDALTEQIGTQLPEGIQISDQQIDSLVTTAEPYFKQRLTSAASDIADYLVGIKQNFSISFSLDLAVPNLKSVAKEAYMAQLPASLQGVSQATIDREFENYYTDFRQTLPSSFSVNTSEFGTDLPDQITEMLNDAQDGLADARDGIDEVSRDLEENLEPVRSYVSIFNTVFILTIILGVLMILGIVLIHRAVRGACRDLGIVFFIYGGIMFAGLLIAKNIIKQQLFSEFTDLPQSLQSLPETLLNNATSPLQIFSLVCLIGGIALIVVSIIYPMLRKSKTA